MALADEMADEMADWIRARRYAAKMIVFLVCALSLLGCRRDDPAPPSAENVLIETSADASSVLVDGSASEVMLASDDSPVVARGGAVSVSLDGYLAALRRSRIMGQKQAAHALADPIEQRLLIDQLVNRALLLSEAARLGLSMPTDEERLSALRGSPLSALADLSGADLEARLEAEFQATPGDLWDAIDESIMAQRLTVALLDGLTDEDFWRLYEAQNTRVSVEMIRLLNVPSPSELSRFVGEHRAQIREYYDTHRGRFRAPALAHVWTLARTIPADASPLDIEKIRSSLEALRSRARYEDLPTLARTYSEDPLTAPLGGRLPALSQAQMPEAFELSVGEPSEVVRRRNQLSFFVVLSVDPPQDRPLDLGLEREIASILLRQQGPSLSARSAALDILSAWKAAPASVPGALVSKHHAEHVPVVTLTPSSARVPNIGPLPAVLSAALGLRAEEPFVREPILDGDSFYIVRLEQRVVPSRTRFNAELPLFRQQVRAQIGPSVLPKHLSALRPSTVKVNLRPLAAQFGVLQRDGTVLFP